MWNLCGQTLATEYITMEWWAAGSAHNDIYSKSGIRIIDRCEPKLTILYMYIAMLRILLKTVFRWETCAGILEQSMEARNRAVIGLYCGINSLE